MLKSIYSELEAIKPFVKRIPGSRPVWHALRKLLKLRAAKDHHAVVFTKIWVENAWRGADSRSGTGSSLVQTGIVREQLAGLLSELSVHCLLDIPCGDFHWMKEVRLPPGLIYIGGDIVEPMVHKNNEQYRTGSVSFRGLDLCRDTLPPADLVLCRDCLVHFSFADLWRAVANLKASGAKYLLVTQFTDNRENSDIETGGWRPLNLTKAPINFPAPLRLIDEQCTEGGGLYRDKSLGLWRIAELPKPYGSDITRKRQNG
jgi:hypothetical protein